MEFRKLVESREIGMYENILENSNEVVLEGFISKKILKERKMAKEGFLKYLEKQYDDFDRSEITGAETEEEMAEVRRKYYDDFKKYAARKDHAITSLIAFVGSTVDANTLALQVVFNILFFRNVGNWLYDLHKDKKDREARGKGSDRRF